MTDKFNANNINVDTHIIGSLMISNNTPNITKNSIINVNFRTTVRSFSAD